MNSLHEDITRIYADLAERNPSLIESLSLLQSTQAEDKEYLQAKACETVMSDIDKALEEMTMGEIIDSLIRICKHPEGREAFKKTLLKYKERMA